MWLSTSDLNTKYFHASAAIRRRSNSINSISLDSGLFLKTILEIGLHFSEYFQNLYTSSYPIFFYMDLDSLFPHVISDADNVDLCCIFEEAEIRSAISALGLHKASGPDGFTRLF